MIRLAVPRCSKVAPSRSRPTSSEITVAPVRTAISSNIALRRSPNPGALHAETLTIPRRLLTTNVASASPSTSSAIINNGLPALATASSKGSNSRMLDIFLSTNKISGLSCSMLIFSWLLIKYGDRYPRSNCMPSTISSSFSKPLPSSTVITPSLPTLAIALAMMSPMSLSLFAEIVPT